VDRRHHRHLTPFSGFALQCCGLFASFLWHHWEESGCARCHVCNSLISSKSKRGTLNFLGFSPKKWNIVGKMRSRRKTHSFHWFPSPENQKSQKKKNPLHSKTGCGDVVRCTVHAVRRGWRLEQPGVGLLYSWQVAGKVFLHLFDTCLYWTLYYGDKQHSLCSGFGLAASGLDGKL
jgi:hypothetical protein